MRFCVLALDSSVAIGRSCMLGDEKRGQGEEGRIMDRCKSGIGQGVDCM